MSKASKSMLLFPKGRWVARHGSASPPTPALGTAEVGIVNIPSLSEREVLFKSHSCFQRSRHRAEKVKVGLELQL